MTTPQAAIVQLGLMPVQALELELEQELEQELELGLEHVLEEQEQALELEAAAEMQRWWLPPW